MLRAWEVGEAGARRTACKGVDLRDERQRGEDLPRDPACCCWAEEVAHSDFWRSGEAPRRKSVRAVKRMSKPKPHFESSSRRVELRESRGGMKNNHGSEWPGIYIACSGIGTQGREDATRNTELRLRWSSKQCEGAHGCENTGRDGTVTLRLYLSCTPS